MQRVVLYYDMFEAQEAMTRNINEGWRVHTCTMSAYIAGYTPWQRVLVVYEK